jgi:hypothetical protein
MRQALLLLSRKDKDFQPFFWRYFQFHLHNFAPLQIKLRGVHDAIYCGLAYVSLEHGMVVVRRCGSDLGRASWGTRDASKDISRCYISN